MYQVLQVMDEDERQGYALAAETMFATGILSQNRGVSRRIN